MAANIERLAQEFAQKGFLEIAAALNANAQIARKLGIPENFSAETESGSIEISALKTQNIRTEMNRISDKEKYALRKRGYLIFGLTEHTIEALKDAGAEFETKLDPKKVPLYLMWNLTITKP